METKEEKLLNAIFGSEPKPKAFRVSLALEDVVVDVAIKKAKKPEVNKCLGNCQRNCSSCKGENCR